jgi:hypothetical protein
MAGMSLAQKKELELERERAEGLLRWHVRLAERLQKEETTRNRCNTELVGRGFAPVLPKRAARVRDAGIQEGMDRDEILAREWYAMSSWQSKFTFVL